jgi:hypothetical protein
LSIPYGLLDSHPQDAPDPPLGNVRHLLHPAPGGTHRDRELRRELFGGKVLLGASACLPFRCRDWFEFVGRPFERSLRLHRLSLGRCLVGFRLVVAPFIILSRRSARRFAQSGNRGDDSTPLIREADQLVEHTQSCGSIDQRGHGCAVIRLTTGA